MSSIYSESSDDDSEPTTVKNLSPITKNNFRKNVNVIVCLSSAITLLLFNFLGALLFYLVENEEDVGSESKDCLARLNAETQLTSEILEELKFCVQQQSSTKIDSLGKSLYFSWTLYSTVGYGNVYPHTTWGRFTAAAYSLMMIPIYIAFKFEFGTLLAQFLLQIIGFFRRKLSAPLPRGITAPPTRDYVIFISSLIFCTVTLLTSSLIFSWAENVEYLSSVYFGIVTMSLIGLGDIVPNDLVWFLVYAGFFLISDVLSNHIFYYCQAKIRSVFHFVARRALLSKNYKASNGTISLNHIPVINTQCMPSHIMECEKNEIDKDERLLTSVIDSRDI